MRRPTLVAFFLFSLGLLPNPPTSAQVNYSSCASDLSDLSDKAENAQRAAHEAESAEQEHESKKNDYESKKDEYDSKKNDYDKCRRFPEIYDLLKDGCAFKYRTARSAQDDLKRALDDLKRAQDDLESAVARLQSTLQDVDSAMSDVQGACGFRTVSRTPVTGVGAEHQTFCLTIRRLRGRLPPDQLLDLCKRSMSEAECRACISGP